MQPDGTTYGFINVTSGGTGSGGSAPADLAKVGGPNQGTYFWAFGEDATSGDGNRGYRAISQNVDVLDDLFHNSFGVPTYRQFTAAGPTTSVTIPAGDLPYVGDTPAVPIGDLFVVTDTRGNELFIPPTTNVVVSSIAGAAIGDGFPTAAVTLNFNTAIGAGAPWSTFRVHYRVHKYLSKATPDPIGRRQVGAPEKVLEQLYALNGSPAANLWWTSAYVSNIWELSLSGLNERYNRKKTADTNPAQPAGAGFPSIGHNVSGSGSWFMRTGRAMSGWTQRDFYSMPILSGKIKYLDPLDAIWTAHLEDFRNENGGGVSQGYGGASGFVAYGARRLNNTFQGASIPGDMPGLAKFMGVSQRRDAFNDVGVLTNITPDTTVAFDTTSSPGEVLLVLPGGSYFHRLEAGLPKTAMAVGYDMLEVEHTDQNANTSRRTYVVSSLNAAVPNKCGILQIDGELPSVANGDTGTLRRWLSMEFFVGDGIDEYRQSRGLANGILPKGFVVAQPPPLTTTPGNVVPTSPSLFFAYDQSDRVTVGWGGFDNQVGPTGNRYEVLSSLRSNGDIFSLSGGVRMSFALILNNITSTTGNISAPAGLVSGLNVLGTGPNGAFNGIVAGKQLGQVTQAQTLGTANATFPVRDGLSMFLNLTYAGPAITTFVSFHYVSVNPGVDSELKFVLYRSNPATTLQFWLPLVYADNGVTPIPTYIDLLDTLLTPTFGPGGAVDVFVGRQMGNAIYWQAVGHYAHPLGFNMNRTYPRQFVSAQRGTIYDIELTGYANGVFNTTVNQVLRGGVGVDFCLARDFSLASRATGPGVTYYEDLWVPPQNPTHAIDTVPSPQGPVICINSIGLVVSSPLTILGAAGDTGAYVDFKVGLGSTGAVGLPLGEMFVGPVAPTIFGTQNIGGYTYPMTVPNQNLGVRVDSGPVVNVPVGAADWANLAAVLAAIQAALPGTVVTTTGSGFLSITSLTPGGSVEVTYIEPYLAYYLGLKPLQKSPPQDRDLLDVAADKKFGTLGTDRVMAVNEGWPTTDQVFKWIHVQAEAKQALVSFPAATLVACDRLVLKMVFNTTAPHSTSSGQLTVWMKGSIFPAF